MITQFIKFIHNKLTFFLGKLTTGPWKIKTIVFISLLSLISSFPDLLCDRKHMDHFVISAVQWQINNPLKPVPAEFIEVKGADDKLKGSKAHIEKRNTRIVIPVFAHLLHLDIWSIMLLQILVSILFLYIVLLIVYEISDDKLLSVTFLLLFSCTLAGKWPFHSIFYFDGYAMFFLALAIYLRNPLLIFLLIILAGFTDERAFIASSFVFIWHQFRTSNFRLNSSLFKLNSISVSIVIAWITYFIFRIYLLKEYELSTPKQLVGLSVIIDNFNLTALSFMLVFEAGWLLVFMMLYKLYRGRNFFNFSILIIAFMISFAAALSVYDIGRSSAYTFSFLIIAFAITVKNIKIDELRKDMNLVAFLCLVIPSHFVFANKVYWLSPVFPKILKLLN
jgi:hypothetical protein